MLAVLLLAVAGTGPARAAQPVDLDLELVLAIDVSRSIDEVEARMQREGTAAALRGKQVIQAIKGGILGKIAVAYLDYSSSDYNEVVVDWRLIASEKDSLDFAARLSAAPLTLGRRTSISDAIEQGVRMIQGNDFQGTRRIIDISGDGPNNAGILVNDARNAANKLRITINGLPIINNRPGFGNRFSLTDLDRYYQGCVIGGFGAFMVIAKDFKDFARAIRRKLIFEIAGGGPVRPPRLLRRVAEGRIGGGAGYTYAKGCDIGERMWQGIRDFPFIDDGDN
ncbi:MAG: DUF1194 domain-containing protein [Rhodospirillales bacterium]|nr:DUF1194 domain-containing protein [Rhodospirillales bacterium]